MSDKRTTLIWTLRDNVSATANRLNNNLDAVGVRAKGATGVLGKLGVATGGLITPTSLAAAGTLAFVGVMAQAVQAAIAEEKNIAKLDAALRANVAGWNGNTDAIEKTINARERLAFDDDALRDSLATLVSATGSVSKAMDIQSTAMDLARLKGISLQEATEALVKVEAGSYRILKSLGIELKKGATQQEALNAVQKVAAGQAAAYADTVEGKLLVAQIKYNDAMEDLGVRVLPIVAVAAERLTDVLEGQLDGGEIDAAHDKYLAYLRDHGAISDAVAEATDDMASSVVLDFERIATAAADTGGSMSDLANTSGDAANDMMEQWTRAADDLIGKAYDPLIEHEQLLATQTEISTLEQIASKRKLTAEERLRLDELHKSEAEHLLALAEAGQTSSGAFENGIADLKEQIKNASGPTKTWLQGVLDQLLLIKKNSTIPISFPTGNLAGGGTGARASGGPVSANTPYMVGEEGPEMFVSSNSGYIVPNDQLSRVSAGGGVSEVHTHIYLDSRQIAESVDRHDFLALQRAPVTAGRV